MTDKISFEDFQNSLTFEEQSTIERLSGQGIATLGNEDKPKAKMMAAFLFIARRRQDPAFKWNDAMALTQADFNAVFEMPEEEADDEAADGDDLAADPFDPSHDEPSES